MLHSNYFIGLGAPSAQRLHHLPRWAQDYERGLRSQANWWHDAQRGRPARSYPLPRDESNRIIDLPVWAFEWLKTLQFEVTWQRDQVHELEPLPSVRHQARPFRSGVLA